MPGSSDSINYSVRPNKAVERKLIVEALSQLSGLMNPKEYRYIGMGAMWYVDFILVHRLLAIDDMVSLEMDNPERADFNRPFSCIKVIPGESTALLKADKLAIADKRVVVWLDYDGTATKSVLEDLQMILWRAQIGSIVVTTVNAQRPSYIRRDSNDQKESLEDSLKVDFATLVPDPFPAKADSRNGFQGLLATMLINHMVRVVLNARKDLELVPLFNFGYEDGAAMITVGGILCDAALRQQLFKLPIMNAAYVGNNNQFTIRVPPLTFREKLAMDRLLPKMQGTFNLVNPESQQERAAIEAAFASELNLKLSAAQISEYSRFYRYYPVFWDATG